MQGDRLRNTDGPLETIVDILRLAVRSVWKRRWMVAVAIEYLRATVPDVKSLRRVTDRPVLGKVSIVVSPAHVLSSRHAAVRFCIAACALLAAQTAWTFWIATRLVGS